MLTHVAASCTMMSHDNEMRGRQPQPPAAGYAAGVPSVGWRPALPLQRRRRRRSLGYFTPPPPLPLPPPGRGPG